MEYAVVGWPGDKPTLDLDHTEFAYAGKFVMSSTGKAVIREDGVIIAAVSFSPDRTDESRHWIRYLTVRKDRRGERLGALLAATTRAMLEADGAEEVRIAVNNPFAYQALWRAGFGDSGEQTGIAERVLSTIGDRSQIAYKQGLSAYLKRDRLSDVERNFIQRRLEQSPPEPITPIEGWNPRAETP